MMYRPMPNPRWTTEDRKRSLARRRLERDAPNETLAPPAAEDEPVTRGRVSVADQERRSA